MLWHCFDSFFWHDFVIFNLQFCFVLYLWKKITKLKIFNRWHLVLPSLVVAPFGTGHSRLLFLSCVASQCAPWGLKKRSETTKCDEQIRIGLYSLRTESFLSRESFCVRCLIGLSVHPCLFSGCPWVLSSCLTALGVGVVHFLSLVFTYVLTFEERKKPQILLAVSCSIPIKGWAHRASTRLVWLLVFEARGNSPRFQLHTCPRGWFFSR